MPVIVCHCGRVVHGDDEEQVLAAMRAHLEAEHPQLAGSAQEPDLRAMVEPTA
jgi:predicted small metal-binding protein